jgi:pimeloyl-ACP methyl ester carboxylesterase
MTRALPMTTSFRVHARLALVLGGLAAAFGTTAATTATTATVSYGQLQFVPCTLSTPGRSITVAARCTRLEVPEDRSRPQGRRIELAIAWVPSTSRSPADDPVFMLAGGPGQSALEAFPIVADAFRDIQRQRHVVLVDQRGTGGSHPLDCPATMDKAMGELVQAADAATARAMARTCLAELRDADPRHYTTNDYVADLEAVRGALGAGQVDLVGVSYGTRVALEYLRRHPERVRAAVLDSVVPPTLILGAEHARNLDDAVDAQFARCARDADCRARFGSPRARLDALLARLRQQPQRVSYRDPVTNEPREDTLTAESVAGVVRLHAYAPQLFAMMPMLLDAAEHGRYDALMAQARMIEQLVGEQISVPLQLSVTCAEDAPWLGANAADAGTLMGSAFVDFVRAQCSVWPRGRAPADFHEPVEANRPVLVLSGEFDPVTPPRYGETVAAMLPDARHLVLRGQGHSVMGISCAPRLVADFFARPEPARLDAKCLDSLGYTPPFAGAYGWDP